AAPVALLPLALRCPGAGPLKGTRRFVKPANAQRRTRLVAAVAEVDHHELWQRARLTIACGAREAREAERLLDEAERYLVGQEWELGPRTRDLVTLDE